MIVFAGLKLLKKFQKTFKKFWEIFIKIAGIEIRKFENFRKFFNRNEIKREK